MYFLVFFPCFCNHGCLRSVENYSFLKLCRKLLFQEDSKSERKEWRDGSSISYHISSWSEMFTTKLYEQKCLEFFLGIFNLVCHLSWHQSEEGRGRSSFSQLQDLERKKGMSALASFLWHCPFFFFSVSTLIIFTNKFLTLF